MHYESSTEVDYVFQDIATFLKDGGQQRLGDEERKHDDSVPDADKRGNFRTKLLQRISTVLPAETRWQRWTLLLSIVCFLVSFILATLAAVLNSGELLIATLILLDFAYAAYLAFMVLLLLPILRESRGIVEDPAGTITLGLSKLSADELQFVQQLRSYNASSLGFVHDRIEVELETIGNRFSMLAGDPLKLGLVPFLLANVSLVFSLDVSTWNIFSGRWTSILPVLFISAVLFQIFSALTIWRVQKLKLPLRLIQIARDLK